LKKGLTWLPWVGADYGRTPGRILIVGESHYSNEPVPENVAAKKAECMKDPKYTREIVAEYPLEGKDAGWPRNNPTFDNLHRALLKTDLLCPEEMGKRGLLWKQIGFYNFVQRPMDCGGGRRERPSPDDFLNGWPIFLEVVRVLRPRTCIFLGVGASNLFNRAMENMGIEHTAVGWGESINRVYRRHGGSLTVDGNPTQLLFMQHTSQFFSWKLWNEYLEVNMAESMKHLRQTVMGGQAPRRDECSQRAEPISDNRKGTIDLEKI